MQFRHSYGFGRKLALDLWDLEPILTNSFLTVYSSEHVHWTMSPKHLLFVVTIPRISQILAIAQRPRPSQRYTLVYQKESRWDAFKYSMSNPCSAGVKSRTHYSCKYKIQKQKKCPNGDSKTFFFAAQIYFYTYFSVRERPNVRFVLPTSTCTILNTFTAAEVTIKLEKKKLCWKNRTYSAALWNHKHGFY